MNQTLVEARVRAALAARAAAVGAPAGLGPAVIERAARVHRRRLFAVSAGAAALVLLLVATLVVGLLSRPAVPPAHRSAPTPASGFTAAPNWDVELRWFEGLPAGPDLVAPFPVIDGGSATGEQLFYVGAVVRLVRDGEGARPGQPLATYAGRTRDAVLVLAAPRGSTALTRLLRIDLAANPAAQPRVTVLADGVEGAAVSRDQREVAVGLRKTGSGTGLAVLDVRDGHRLAARTDQGVAGERVVGWSGGRVVAARTSSTGTRVVAWAPGGRVDDLGTLPGGSAARLESAAGLPARLLVSRQGPAYETCGSVLPLDDLTRPITDGCYRAAPVSLAADGRHALLSDFSVVDLDTGRTTRSSVPGGVAAQDPVWEDDTHVVAAVPWTGISYDTGPGWFTTVRCDVSGAGCERVRQPADLGLATVAVPLP